MDSPSNFTPLNINHKKNSNLKNQRMIIAGVFIISILVLTGVSYLAIQNRTSISSNAQFVSGCEAVGGAPVGLSSCPPGSEQVSVQMTTDAGQASVPNSQEQQPPKGNTVDVGKSVIDGKICCKMIKPPVETVPTTSSNTIPVSPAVNKSIPTEPLNDDTIDPTLPNDPVVPTSFPTIKPTGVAIESKCNSNNKICPPGYDCPDSVEQNQKPLEAGRCKAKGSICNPCVCFECRPKSGGAPLEYWRCAKYNPITKGCDGWTSCNYNDAEPLPTGGVCAPEPKGGPTITPSNKTPIDTPIIPPTQPLCPNTNIPVTIICPNCNEQL